MPPACSSIPRFAQERSDRGPISVSPTGTEEGGNAVSRAPRPGRAGERKLARRCGASFSCLLHPHDAGICSADVRVNFDTLLVTIPQRDVFFRNSLKHLRAIE